MTKQNRLLHEMWLFDLRRAQLGSSLTIGDVPGAVQPYSAPVVVPLRNPQAFHRVAPSGLRRCCAQ
jgi:hypothetical protein